MNAAGQAVRGAEPSSFCAAALPAGEKKPILPLELRSCHFSLSLPRGAASRAGAGCALMCSRADSKGGWKELPLLATHPPRQLQK